MGSRLQMTQSKRLLSECWSFGIGDKILGTFQTLECVPDFLPSTKWAGFFPGEGDGRLIEGAHTKRRWLGGRLSARSSSGFIIGPIKAVITFAFNWANVEGSRMGRTWKAIPWTPFRFVCSNCACWNTVFVFNNVYLFIFWDFFMCQKVAWRASLTSEEGSSKYHPKRCGFQLFPASPFFPSDRFPFLSTFFLFFLGQPPSFFPLFGKKSAKVVPIAFTPHIWGQDSVIAFPSSKQTKASIAFLQFAKDAMLRGKL